MIALKTNLIIPTDGPRTRQRPPIKFYTDIPTRSMKNWSKDFIKRGLSIDDTLYGKVYREIEDRISD